MRLLWVFLIALLQTGCTGIADGITPVQPFELNRYLGSWYEIARLDHSFERGLEQVSAEYTLRDDGGVQVINRGYSPQKQQWQQAIGKAFFVDDSNTGHLKVSFFGPFYGSYVVFQLDQQNYQYAFVTSYNKDYLWLLARTPTVPDSVREEFVQMSARLGYATDEIIFVPQPRQAE